MALDVLAVVLLLGANFFFVATEFSIARARPTEVVELAGKGVRGAGSLRHAVEHIDAYLSACQLGITVASIGLGIFGKPLFERLLEPVFARGEGWLPVSATIVSFAFAYAVVSTLHVVVGELSPKSLAIARTRPTGLVVAPPMRLFYLATKPVVDGFNWAGNLLLRPFGIPPAREAGHVPHTESELRSLIRESQREGELEPEEREFAENVFTFGDRRAREAMVPRADVRYLTTEQSIEDAADVLLESGHARLPVCEPEGELDAAVGIVHVRDVLRGLRGGTKQELRELARPLPRVADAMLLDDLLERLREDRRHMALVVDEHGTALGVITLEDVLEEIVGDIRDEFDPEAEQEIRREDGRVVVRGTAPLRAVSDRLRLGIGDVRSATIGGYVVELLGRVPEPGEVVEIEGREARVTAADEAHVLELAFEPRTASEER